MNKIQNGLILIGAGVAMNILGRLIMPAVRGGSNVVVAGLMAVWMLASVVLVLFGLFRLIAGLATKNHSS